MQRYFEIQQALLDSNGVIWDDHNGGSESKLSGCAALVNGDKVITVALHDADYFSLNRLYLKDGKVHLSSESVGGVLFPVNHKDVWDCINDYNEKQHNNQFSCGTLENPTSFGKCPITVVTLTPEEWEKRLNIVSSGVPHEETVKRVSSLNVDYLNPEDEMMQDAYHRRLLAGKEEPGVKTSIRTDVDLNNPIVIDKL